MNIEWTREYSQKVNYKWCIAAEAVISGRRLRVDLHMDHFVYVASLDGAMIPGATSPEMREALANAEAAMTALLASGGTLPVEVETPPPSVVVHSPHGPPVPPYVANAGIARTHAREEMGAKIKAASAAKALAKAQARIAAEVSAREAADAAALAAALEGAAAAAAELAEAEAVARALVEAEDAARLEAEAAAIDRAEMAKAARKAALFVPVPKPVPGQPEVAHFRVQHKANVRRIWVDGARLTRAGFTGGTEYRYTIEPGRIVCTPLSPEEAAERVASKRSGPGFRKIVGRPGGKPIMEMLGRDVVAAFPTGDLLHVVFEPGRITITLAED